MIKKYIGSVYLGFRLQLEEGQKVLELRWS